MEFLKQRKTSAIKGVEEQKRKRENQRRPPGGGKPHRTTTTYRGKDQFGNKGSNSRKCYFCHGSDCKVPWSGLGCLEMYQLQTIEERLNWLKAHGLCFRCGNRFIFDKSRQGQNSRHTCQWFAKDKLQIKCTEDNCWTGAASCQKHKNNLSKELINWLKGANVDVKNLAQGILYGFQTGKDLDPKTNNIVATKHDRFPPHETFAFVVAHLE